MSASTNPGLLGRLVGIVIMSAMLVLGIMFSMVLLVIALATGVLAFGYFWWKTRTLRQAMRAHAAQAQQQAQPDGQVIEGEAVVIEAWRPSLPEAPGAASSGTTFPDADGKA